MIKLPDSLFVDRLLLDKKKLLLVVIISLMVIILDISFVLKVQFAGLGRVAPKIAKLKGDLSSLNKGLQNMQDLTNKQAEEKSKNAVKLKKIISEGKITILLQDISETAKKDGIRISQMKYALDSSGPKQVGSEKLLPYLISLDLSSDYHTLGKFLNQLENGQIFVGVQDLRITPGDVDVLKQKVFVTLKTYVRK
jgi:Tfp pilus assembly protein PilO